MLKIHFKKNIRFQKYPCGRDLETALNADPRSWR